MQSIRWRLTLFYGVALMLTIALFGGTLYWERRASAERERELQTGTRLEFEASLVRRAIEERGRLLPRLVQQSAPLGRPGEITFELVPEIGAYLDGLSGFLIVMDPSGRMLYVSEAAASIDPSSLNLVRRLLLRQPILPRRESLVLEAGDEPYRVLIDTLGGPAGREVRAFMVAAQPSGQLYGPSQLLVSMLLVAPFILIASSLLGYWLAGRSLTPLEQMIQEVEAITDGRSLHRRVAVPSGNDELARLGANLNAMLGRVERSFVALRRFTADASHELKTPLMVLRAGVERALTHPETPGEMVDSLDETLRQINEMTELVTNLLTLARVDEGRSTLLLVETDLVPLVAEAAETAELLGEQHGVIVSFDLAQGPVRARVEPGRIRQLLMNLLTNAIKYTPRGGEVEVALGADHGDAVLLVRDTGIGIAPGDVPHVFERFWRADPARSRTGERPGVGLGLAITKWIVEAHEGTITVQSRPGRGTTFTVRLPLAQAGEAPSRSE
jgi:signal transduction histidine kinase